MNIDQADLRDSVAKQTVKFGRPITGRELVAAVQSTCQNGSGSFYESKKYDDGWLHAVGQKSRNPADNLLVTPDRETPYIVPDKTYSEAVVQRYDSPDRGAQTMARLYVEDEVSAVVDFAKSLKQTVERGAEAGTDRSREVDAREAGAGTSQPAAGISWPDPAQTRAGDRSSASRVDPARSPGERPGPATPPLRPDRSW